MPRHHGPKKSPGQKKPPLTHFLCLPLVTPESRPQLKASLQQFRAAAVVRDPSQSSLDSDADENKDEHDFAIRVVHPKAIRPVGALHCTLGVMSLSKDKLKEAVEVLGGLDYGSILAETGRRSAAASASEAPLTTEQTTSDDGTPSLLKKGISAPPSRESGTTLSVTLKGLVSMHNPSNTSILYTAPTDRLDRLHSFCLAVQKIFNDRGLLVPDDRELKLHATIVNMIYAKGKKRPPPRQAERVASAEERQDDERSQGHGPRAKAPMKIDANAILEKFKDFVWAEDVMIDRIAICEMGAKKVMNASGVVIDEEYTEVACLPLRPD